MIYMVIALTSSEVDRFCKMLFCFAGLTLSDDCDSDELMSCFKQVQQSKDMVWIESIRSAVINNLKELESIQECFNIKNDWYAVCVAVLNFSIFHVLHLL
jgi:hypothetical protein